MLGPSQLCRVRLASSAVEIGPKCLGAKYVVLRSSESPLPCGGASGVFGARPKCRTGMVDSLSEGVILKREGRKVLMRGEERIVFPLPIDDVGALKPFLWQHPL